ncbi:Mannose-binding protein C [Orchesella cincta]|uniref:Mannose-binding protein C n=1 Tax=Orchesella cincta TaxID=48709 RepID=A0A1D2NKT3_ORCCI|nr:Mannose-binding protein C [Orchesella cincta]
MAKVGISIIICTLCSLAIAVVASPIQIHAGFEFLGTVEGKIFVRPILGPGSDNLTYQDAIATCASAGYRIATLESQAQNDIAEQNLRWSWIDGIDLQTPDVFFSVNTGKNLTYFNWGRNRPVIGKDDRNCIRFSCAGGVCEWLDVKCTDKYTVICQLLVQ